MSEIKSLIDDDIKENIDHSAICVKFAMMSKQIENKDKEINRLNNIIKEQGLEDKPNYYVKGLEGSLKEYQEEVKRLNNIINEFEILIKNEINESKLEDNYERVDNLEYCLATLKELKRSDK